VRSQTGSSGNEFRKLSGIQLLELTPQIAIESTLLPGEFHKAPADQIITATGRVLGIPLLTADEKILNYPHVNTLTE
jgi:PIN domain nuclease of toxin-antitoxin system